MDTVKEQLTKDVTKLKQQVAELAALKQQVAELREKLAAHNTHAVEASPVPAPSTKRGWGGKK